MGSPLDRVMSEVDRARDEIVSFAAELVRVPTVNPPGEAYEDCARVLGDRLARFGFEVEFVTADGRPEHTARYPRVNVIGTRYGRAARPLAHLNGHLDVVPAGEGWTVAPFEGTVRGGRLYGRGACDMKAGIAAAVYAVEALRRAGCDLIGTVEVSGTVDEESGGFAGVGYLAEQGRLAVDRTDYVIIPEPLDVDRIGVGHRGVYWFEITTYGRIAHGSMPFLGANAIEAMGRWLEAVRRDLKPRLAARCTRLPVVPAEARRATLNINGIEGGQPVDLVQTPCVADRCRAVFDRRFLPEESFPEVRAEIASILADVAGSDPPFTYALRDLLVVEPVETPADSPLIAALERAIERVLGRPAQRVASPGTYDQKHVQRIAGIRNCVAYGPGRLELAHQPDEHCAIDELVAATKVLAVALVELGVARGRA
jgi:succinyl-diaminopimelate desuccinylase